MRRYKYAKITDEQRKELETLNGNKEISKQESVRIDAIILSSRGYVLDDISEIYEVDRDTVSKWIDRWEKYGIEGLLNAPKQGSKPKLNEAEQSLLKELLEKYPRSANEVLGKLKTITGKEVSVWTIRRWAKRFNLRWKRMKKGLAKKKDETEYAQAKKDIEGFEQLQAQGDIDLYYFDATGFDLTPTVPYAWQPIGSTIEIPSSHSKRINVLGFLNPQTDDLHPYMIEGNVNSEVIISCFNQFSEKIEKQTVIILDNAPTHTSKRFSENIDKLREKGVFIYFIPPYSPSLNFIEILWRKMKYEWLPIQAYRCFDVLRKSIETILIEYGTKYQICSA